VIVLGNSALPRRPSLIVRLRFAGIRGTRGGVQASAREGANGAAQGGICGSGGARAFAADVRFRAIGRAMFFVLQ
jgi:hypothetical protein